MSIGGNIEYVRDLKAKAAERSGRNGEDVLLVAVTKLHDVDEINEATRLVRDVVSENVHLIFGADIRETMSEEIIVTIIATGFPEDAKRGSTLVSQLRANAPNQPAQQTDRIVLPRSINAFGNPAFESPAQSEAPMPEPIPSEPTQPTQPERPKNNGSVVDIDDDFPVFLRRIKK